MRIGVDIYPTIDVPPPDELARLAEERGFECLLFPEHTHVPADGSSLYPGTGGPHARMLDPFVALTAAAAATERLRIGTGICLVGARDPIITANAVASLDLLSGGRFVFGVGGGWNRTQIANHGTDFDRRFGVIRERIEAMQAIWTQEEASYAGEHVRFGPMWSWPKPVQRPHPPILVGGMGPRVLDRVLAYGDGWYPNAIEDVGGLLARVAELRARAAEAGRNVSVSLNMTPLHPRYVALAAEAGIERAVFRLPQTDRAGIEQQLDRVLEVVRAAGIDMDSEERRT